MGYHHISERKATCNTIGGILLAYVAIMLVATTISSLFSMGYASIMGDLNRQFPTGESNLLPESIDEGGPGYILTALLVMLMIRLWKGQGYLPKVIKKQRAMSFPAFLGILAVFLSVQTISSILITFNESILNHWGMSSLFAMEQASGQSSSLSMFLYVGIFAPIVEEFMFRGAIYDSLLPFGKRFAMVSSALLFGLFHGNLVQIPFAFLTGLVLAYVRSEYSIGWCILLHFINNCLLAELLAPYEDASNVILIVSVVVAVLTLTLRGNHLRHWIKSIPATAGGAYRDLFVNPLTIILMVYCLLSTVATIALTTIM